MTVSRLLKEANSKEIAEWIAFFIIEAKQEKEKEKQSLKDKFRASIAGWNIYHDKSR